MAGLLAFAFARRAEAAEALAPPTMETPRASGVSIALSSGFAIPVGSTFKGSGDLGETMSGQLPIRLDLGYRFAERLYVGVDVGYGVLLPRACPGASCAGSDLRFGAVVAYHHAPFARFDPWIGIGTGFEMLHVTRTIEGMPLDLSARGMQVVNAQLGVDVSVSRHLRLGPVLSAMMGDYTTLTVNGAPTRDFESILHEWVDLGIRGVFSE